MKLITILGPTATGKTQLAAALAHRLGGEVISADSRQVYRGMDIGTGKDLDDYYVEGNKVPCHLVDIAEAGYEYNVFEYQKDFLAVYTDIVNRNMQPILCGGSGMYIEAVLKGYKLTQVPIDIDLRSNLELKADSELFQLLKSLKKLHNDSDFDTRKRAIRAIEIEMYYQLHPELNVIPEPVQSDIFGIIFDRNTIKRRITSRLKERLKGGMIDEVKQLLDRGLTPDQLRYYGLEYKFITRYIQGELSYQQMFDQLNVAIHHFSKRQMTWFRKMEREGFNIRWIDGYLDINRKIELILKHLEASC